MYWLALRPGADNRVYIGEIFFQERHHKAPHPRIVDMETFEAAQSILASRAEEASRRSNTSDYLLTGLVVCSKCGKKFIGAAANGRNGRYPYYVCFSRQRYGPQECDQDRLPSLDLEERVVESLSSTFSRRDLLPWRSQLPSWVNLDLRSNESWRPSRRRFGELKERWIATSTPSRLGRFPRRCAANVSRS